MVIADVVVYITVVHVAIVVIADVVVDDMIVSLAIVFHLLMVFVPFHLMSFDFHSIPYLNCNMDYVLPSVPKLNWCMT